MNESADSKMEIPRDGGAPEWLSRRGFLIAMIGFVMSEAALSFTTIPDRARHCASITILTALCWTLEAMPLGAASLLPLALFPLFGVLPAGRAATTYFDDINFLFLGGMIVGASLERWNLHRRIALSVVKVIGTSPRKIILGFLLGTAFISMWISNTATAVMMFPIALAVVETAGLSKNDPGHRAFACSLLLVIAYGANIGGIGTPIGTGPNFAFYKQFNGTANLNEFAAPAFANWMMAMAPLLFITGLIGWWLVTRVVVRVPREIPKLTESFEKASALGPWTKAEARTAILFFVAVALWIGRTLPVNRHEYGWLQFFPENYYSGVTLDGAITSSTVAILIAIIAFVTPAGDAANSKLVDASAIRNIPWDMLLLLGGGFAIADAFQETKLSQWMSGALAPALGGASPWILIIAFSTFVTFLSEVTSNTATSLIMLPIAAEIGRASGVDPRLPAISVTLAASLAFMLPIGTPPNAIVFSSGRIPMFTMIRAGFLLNLASILLSTIFVLFVIAPIFGIRSGVAQ